MGIIILFYSRGRCCLIGLIMTVSSSASCHMPAYKAAIYIYNLEPLNVTVMSWMLT